MDAGSRISLRLNDLEVQKLKVRDSIAKLSDAPHMREKLRELSNQLAELEKMTTVEEAKVTGGATTVKQLGDDLRKAVATSDLDAVKRLCSEPRVDKFINSANFEGTTALIKAAIFDRIEIVEALIAAGADAALMDDRGRSALMLAAANGGDAVVRRLLELSMPATAVAESNGWNAFMFAVQGGHLSAAKMLLEASDVGSCLDAVSTDGKRALDLVDECTDRAKAQRVHNFLRKLAEERGEDTTSWSPLRQLNLASTVASAFEKAGRNAEDKPSTSSFASVLRQASEALKPMSLLRALRRSWTRAQTKKDKSDRQSVRI